MKKIPWKGIFIGCTIMAVLVIARCIATGCMTWYYIGSGWWNKIFTDPWTYVGIAAALVAVIACLMWLMEKKKAVAE